ncbi:hypothetical protein HYU22_05140 [Candidatus Woesearchaeota archaeon]|nr:hypothetical protein [Candidatus Woesearchaeota archaeon]
MIEKLLKFGLAEKEAKVYLSCLELGDAVASDIALKSNLPRTLVYDILERLIDLGLVSYAIKTNKKVFRAADPEELLRIIHEKEEAVKEVLPELKRLQKIEGVKRPKVEIYEGKEGMKTVMNDILRSGAREFLAYGSSKSSFPIIPAFMEEWHQRRAKQKVFMRVLYNDSPEARKRVKQFIHTFKHAEYRFMPIKVHSPTATLIYSNRVVLQSWTGEPFSVMIENEEMARNQKRYFEELWKIAKK